jgi:DNA repair protein RadD
MYRKLISALIKINPNLRIVGMTATPYRLGHGMITDAPAIFSELIEPASIEQLQAQGYLSKLRSKATDTKISIEGVHKRGGEYIEKELQLAVDIEEKNILIADEIIVRAGDRKHWLIFCTGVKHAYHMRDALLARGIIAETVTGATPKLERERILNDYKAGKITALTNADVLSRGFDFPDIDLIALLRPTMSPNKYLQQVGRGLRIKSHTDHCLVLDFAGVIEQHGPVTGVNPPEKKGESDGIAPSKACPNCSEIVPISARICPACEYQFPPPEGPKLMLRDDDIMGIEPSEMKVSEWTWRLSRSKTSDMPMIIITYYGRINEVLKEYLLLWHDGFAGLRAQARLKELAIGAAVPIEYLGGDDATNIMEKSKRPFSVKYKMEGKYPRIFETVWYDEDPPF